MGTLSLCLSEIPAPNPQRDVLWGPSSSGKPWVHEAGTIIAASWVAQIQTLLEGIARLDQAIEPVASQHPDAYSFADLPGAGPALRPRLIAAFGHRRDRYTTAIQLQSYGWLGSAERPIVGRLYS